MVHHRLLSLAIHVVIVRCTDSTSGKSAIDGTNTGFDVVCAEIDTTDEPTGEIYANYRTSNITCGMAALAR